MVWSSSGYRTFNRSGDVVTWIQRRCKICQRFLGKKEIKFCDRCRPKEDLKVRVKRMINRYHSIPSVRANHLDYVKIHYQTHKEDYKLRSKVRRIGIENISVGDHI
jgi:hypothetical protein